MNRHAPALAEHYYRLGLPVVPVAPGSKFPAVPWTPFQREYPTLDEIEAWWEATPEAGIAAVLQASPFLVVDEDGPHAADLVRDAGWCVPGSPIVRTGSGGHHRWFRKPAGVVVRDRIRLLHDDGSQVDVRATGVVILPPTIHPNGRAYEWLTPLDDPEAVPLAPDSLLEACQRLQATADEPMPDGPITEGYREKTVTRLLGAARRCGAQPNELLTLAEAVNQRCQPRLSADELWRMAHSIGRYPTVADDTPEIEHDAERTPTPSHDAVNRIVRVRSASDIQIRPVQWLWEQRLPLGALALLGGREGIGKSLCIYTLAADVTRGRLAGVFAGQSKGVIVAATEDSWEHTIVPRLMAADADLRRVHPVDVETAAGVSTNLCLPRDLPGLQRVIADQDAALVLLDPLLSRLDAKIDTHKDAEVRIALEPLASLADRTHAAVVGLIHVNKSASSDALNTLMGSRAFAAVARAVLFVMADPDDDQIRLLGQSKNNLGRTDLPTLRFRVVDTFVADTPEGPVYTGKIDWLGESDRSIKAAIEAATQSAGERTATAEAADWLHDYLVSQGGECDSAAAKAAGKLAGHSLAAIQRGRTRLQLHHEERGFPRRTYWSLPQSSHSGGLSLGESAMTETTGTTGQRNGQLSQSLQSSQLSQTPRAHETTETHEGGSR